MRVASASLNQTPLDWNGNSLRIRKAIEEAKRKKATLLCLPELAISGYGCEDAFFRQDTIDRALRELRNLLSVTSEVVVTLGLPLPFEGKRYNCCVIASQKKIFGIVPKQVLANDGLHYEHRWFEPWPSDQVSRLKIFGQTVPFGDILFDAAGVCFGIEICRDAWIKERPAKRLKRRGATLILNPSASHFAFEKQKKRDAFMKEARRDLGLAFVFSNLQGNESGRAIYDGGCVIADAKKKVMGDRLSFRDIDILVSDLEVSRPKKQARDVIRIPLKKIQNAPALPSVRTQSLESKFEEFTRAVGLGLFDYLRKSKSRGFVLSLSGGADSSATACLVTYGLAYAIKDLGLEECQRRFGLGSIENSFQKVPPQSWMKGLLTCIYQRSSNSSLETEQAAESLAKFLGAEYWSWSIDSIVQTYKEMAQKALGRDLKWETDGIALQNIQARNRSPGAWLVANLKSQLLLVTCNRSESSVGYATMDGDTSGSLAPIAGISKTFIRGWLRWACEKGPQDLFPIPVLQKVLSQKPTAELLPKSYEQTDEEDLMPYEVLDTIERELVFFKRSRNQILKTLENKFAWKKPVLEKWLDKFLMLFSTSQWKRDRMAPSFHLDESSLDPKGWFRFPILSGGLGRTLGQ